MDKLEFSNANDMELNREDILFCQAKMLDEVCDAIIATDMDSDIVYWNEKAESTYGWTKEEALGQNVKSLLQSHYLCVSQEEPRRRLIMGKATSTECIHVCRHGSKINVMEKSSLMVDEKGTPVGFISMIWDITERKRMEELARRSEEVLRRNEERQAFLLKLNDQIHHLTNITLISQIATRLLTEHLGASRSSYSEINQQQFIIKRVIPMCRESVIHDIHLPEYSEEERSFYLSQNICACISVPIIKRYIPVANLTVIQDTPRNWLPEEVELVQETARRILESVERVRASEALLKVEREKNAALERSLALKEEFLSFVSHEFKTPINVINTAVQALNLIYADEMPSKVKKYINIIRQNTYRQMRLVNNILDVARANEGRINLRKINIDIVSLTKAITESVESYAADKGVKVRFFSSIESKIIGIDDEKYERILLNLLSNGIKFTPKDKFVDVSLDLHEDKIRVEVRDSGIGIPSDKLDFIFGRFNQLDNPFSKRAEGSGIGLSLVKAFVEALGGSISVKSQICIGTTFTILLPDEMVGEEQMEMPITEFTNGSRLIQSAHIEFSDIYSS